MVLAWLWLAAAIGLEVAGTVSMKLSDGFRHLVPSVLIFVFYAAAFTALNLALRRLDLSVAYAVWAGVGTALVAGVGILFFREPATVLRLVSIALIIFGVIGLNAAGGGH